MMPARVDWGSAPTFQRYGSTLSTLEHGTNMNQSTSNRILVSEVGPRDGLQSRQGHHADRRQAALDRRAARGRPARDRGRLPSCRPQLLPQMADAAEVVRACAHAAGPHRDGAGAQPARRRRRRSRPACTSSPSRCRPARRIRWPTCARRASRWSRRCAPSSTCAARSRRRSRLEAGISTAFGCTLQGEVPEDEVIRLAAQCVGGRRRRIGPVRHHRLRQSGAGAAPVHARCARRSATQAGAAHMHNTRGLGLANCLAAYDDGVRTFDASLGRPRRLPLRARRLGQRGHRRPGLHVRGHGRAHRHRPRQADGGARAAAGGPAGRAGLRHDAGGRPAQGFRPRLVHEPPMPEQAQRPLPLAGIRVVEFTHMVMGPTCGMVLADLGAEVIKVEPIDGDNTRTPARLRRRLLPDVQPQQEEHRARPAAARGRARPRCSLIATADVVSENFRPGTMEKLGLDYASAVEAQPAPDLRAATRASCPAPTSTAPRSTRWCR